MKQSLGFLRWSITWLCASSCLFRFPFLRSHSKTLCHHPQQWSHQDPHDISAEQRFGVPPQRRLGSHLRVVFRTHIGLFGHAAGQVIRIRRALHVVNQRWHVGIIYADGGCVAIIFHQFPVSFVHTLLSYLPCWAIWLLGIQTTVGRVWKSRLNSVRCLIVCAI